MDDQQFNIEVAYHDEFDYNQRVTTPVIRVFEDVIGYQMGSQAVAIMTKTNETIIIPISEFKQVRHYPASV